ncbi:methylenetetrahydrofolate reductase [NAD(P)H] [Alcanivorax quisquiliarum]|uniref:Methylenetetrahydrofolate reductase n=1 Tax=Alcanivorax quisquiliarum TaxID=2933565 RepID=A0ABT0E5E1_9GAMM|nr:methylenetetrahydrofolate reductase [NAD(P)H] [Alcanivorax quisquiliarum]MCK0537040.1 methylenetetrahydrofolate reductase [NAD(P)H] [Alcanivorax quisquiliarum]
MTAKRISFEFFPPKTSEGLEKLLGVQQQLLARKPAFFSCTYGAGGSTRDNTLNTVAQLREHHADTAPHLSCIGEGREELVKLINGYRDSGVTRIVALRGDLPSGMGYAQGELKYADDLVRLIREVSGDHFTLEVAAYPEMHPQARSFADDIAHFKRKIDAGANAGLTQYFYNADAYGFFMDALQKQGCDAPVYPGIMPILNVANLIRFSNTCGADIPRWLASKLNDLKDDEVAVRAFGTEIVTRLCERLLAMGAPGLHFYTMNQAAPTLKVLDNLGL